MYDFLNNFHKRMEKISYSFLIDYKVSLSNAFKDDFNNIELINLVYTLMCYVLDCSLRDEECTLSDMNIFLEEILINYYEKNFLEEEVSKLTKHIVYKILRNDGKPFEFSSIDYINNEKKSFNYHLLKQKPSKKDYNKGAFFLTKEGYRLILGALEVDERTQIDINQMILELSLEKKNFSQGLMAVENLNSLITAQINILNNFIYQARENIFSLEQKQFEENFMKDIEVLKEQNNKFDELSHVISAEEKRLLQANDNISSNEYQSLKQLVRIKELLHSITYKAGDLISKHFQFKEEYIKAIEEASYYYYNKRINIKDEIIKPIEEDASRLEEIYKLFYPLFKPRLRKHFNINYIFNEQNLYQKEDDELDIEVSFLEDEEKERLEKQKSREEYEGIVCLILEFIINNKETDLETMIEYYNKQPIEVYRKLIPTIRKFSEVIIDLLRIGVINIREIINEQQEAYEHEEIEYDLRLLLVNEFVNKYAFQEINKLSIYKMSDIKMLEIKEKIDENHKEDIKMLEVLRCPNIIMKVE